MRYGVANAAYTRYTSIEKTLYYNAAWHESQ